MPAWPAYQVEKRNRSDLHPFPRNARTHSPEQVQQIAASIREWGWTSPALIDPDGEIIAGHARVLAAELLGLEEIPVIVARGWTEPQKRAYLLADNKLALNAGWDDALLRLEVGDLQAAGVDIGLAGFSDGDLAQLFLDRADGETDANAEWQGMPGFTAEDRAGLKCIVHFESAEDLHAFELLIGQPIPTNTHAVWYPRKQWANMKAQVWSDGAAVPALHPEQRPVGVHDHVEGADADGRASHVGGRAARG